MKMFKNIMALLTVFVLVFSLFIPVWATESDTVVSSSDSTDVVEGEQGESGEEASTASKVIEKVEVSPARVMDYTKQYHVATVSVKDCAKIKWYFITVDGNIYNMGSVNEHHDSTYEITWNSLDANGKHPAGAWNKPVTVRFSLVIVATSITGEEEACETWFEYSWYDSENAQAATASETPAATTTPRSSSVPHTGL